MYNIESIGNYFKENNNQDNLENQELFTVLYCRVSSKKQIEDLKRQQELLEANYSNSIIIKDVGSGLNYSINGFSNIVKQICRNQISRIVVTFKDRLLRFGFELFEQICKEHNVQIIVHCNNSIKYDENNETTELQEDLLSIVNVFVARRNGKKASMLKKLRKEQIIFFKCKIEVFLYSI